MSNENFEMENQVKMTDKTAEISNELLEVAENPELIEKTKPKKKLLVGILIAVFAVILCFCAVVAINGRLANKVEKIFEKVGLEITDTKIICADPLNFSGDSGNDLKLILLRTTYNGLTEHFTAVFDLEEEVYYVIDMAYPFNSLMTYASIMGSEQLNEDLYYEIKARIEMGGLDYFENAENSMKSFNEVIGEDGIVSVDQGRKIMMDSLPLMYGEDTVNGWKEADGFCVLFEIGTAVPKVIAGKTMVNKYQWSSIYPESHLNYLDSQTRSIFTYEFGPAYKLVEKWTASVINRETGDKSEGRTFNSLEAIKAQYNVE